MDLAKEVLDALITSNVVKNTKRPMQLIMYPLSITVVCRVAAIPLCTPLPPVVITIFSRIDELVPGTHFTNDFSITIPMWWEFNFALI